MKNAINVIDQELIDWFDGLYDGGFGVVDDRVLELIMAAKDHNTKKLLTMAKDLIEINAELMKENQKFLNHIEDDIKILQRQAKQYVLGSYELKSINLRIKSKQDLKLLNNK